MKPFLRNPTVTPVKANFTAGHAPLGTQHSAGAPIDPLDLSDQVNVDPKARDALELLSREALRNSADITTGRGGPSLPARLLRGFQHGHPFVPVYPAPQEVVSVKFSGAGAADLQIPDQAIIGMLTATPGSVVYLNLNGVATNATSTTFDPSTMIDPTGFLMFCYGRHFWSLAADGACIVSGLFWMQDELAGIM
jgi:hypothetical protein